jgi:ribose transport system permease protein
MARDDTSTRNGAPRSAATSEAPSSGSTEIEPQLTGEVELPSQTGTGAGIGILDRLLQYPQAGIVVALILFPMILSLRSPIYLSHGNVIEILRSTVYIFIIGVASTLVFIAGGLDLSVGSLFAVGNIGTAYLLVHGVSVVPAMIVGGVLLGVLAGAINGFVIVYFGIPALITTLGMLYVAAGLIVVVTGGVPLYPFPDVFNNLGQGSVLGIPYLVLYAVAAGILGHIVLEYTKFGFDVRATGGNREAARAAGVKVNRVSMTVYILSGISATIAGMLLASQLGSGQPSVGATTELQVIAAVIIGGTSLFGGIGTIIGTALGALLLSVIQDGLLFLNLDPAYQNVATGLIIVLAVGLDRLRRIRMWRRGHAG